MNIYAGEHNLLPLYGMFSNYHRWVNMSMNQGI